jgi:hypothetical protein
LLFWHDIKTRKDIITIRNLNFIFLLLWFPIKDRNNRDVL